MLEIAAIKCFYKFCLFLCIRIEVHHFLWRICDVPLFELFCDYFWGICVAVQSSLSKFFCGYKAANELPVCDWLATWKQTPEHLNYSPLVSMRPPQCDVRHVCRQAGFHTPGWPLLVAVTRNRFVNKMAWSHLGIKAFSIHVFTDPLTLFSSAKWIWLWLMNNGAWTDPPFNPYLPPCVRLRFVYRVQTKQKQV